MNTNRVVAAIVLAVMFFCVIITLPMLAENVGPDELTVIQSPIEGQLTWYTQQGLKWQGMGNVTAYLKRDTYQFGPTNRNEECSEKTGGIPVRFNDGGHGTICGSIQFELPSAEDKLNNIHMKYKTQDAVKRDIIETLTNNAIYMTGPLMTSKESYAEKRNDLIHYVLDQVQNGVYRTRKVSTVVKDIAGNDKQTDAADIMLDPNGEPMRQQESLLHRYGIVASNFAISRLPYDKAIEAQITQQQQITMDVQTSIADALKAEQRARTVEQQGRANAAEAKWAQETIKAKAVTEAEQIKVVAETRANQEKQVAETEAAKNLAVQKTAKETAEVFANQRLTVADLDRRAAEQTKLQQIALGEGEAKRKQLIIEADGALELKAKTYENVMGKIFENLKNTPMVPSIVMGSAGTTDQHNATDFINILTMKAAKDLDLDMKMQRAIPMQR